MSVDFTGPVKLAVERVGGPSRTANILGVSTGAVHDWIRKGRVPNFDRALKLAELSGFSARSLRGQ